MRSGQCRYRILTLGTCSAEMDLEMLPRTLDDSCSPGLERTLVSIVRDPVAVEEGSEMQLPSTTSDEPGFWFG